MTSQNPLKGMSLEGIEIRDRIETIGDDDFFKFVGFPQNRAGLDYIEDKTIVALNPDYFRDYTTPLRRALFPSCFEGGAEAIEVIVVGQNRSFKVGQIAVPRAILLISGDVTSTGRGKIGRFSSTVAYTDREKRTLATQDDFMRAVQNSSGASKAVALLQSSSTAYF